MAPPASLFADLEIRIMAKQASRYPVEITLDRDRELGRGFLDPSLAGFVPTADPQADGERLFGGLFQDPALSQAWGIAAGASRQRRIRLRVDEGAPELHALPWERVRDPAAAIDLAADPNTPFSRYLAGEWRPGRAVLSRPIRMLVAISNPKNLGNPERLADSEKTGWYNLPPIAEAEEWQAVCDALAGQDVQIERYPAVGADGDSGPCTLDGLKAELSKGYHVLHFIGHGLFNERSGLAALLMANEQNLAEWVNEDRLAEALASVLAGPPGSGDEGRERLRLVFLASCSTAQHSPADAFRGMAPRLVQAGVPAVVAMQDLVPVEAARIFAAGFYRHLLAHGQADLACNEARGDVLAAAGRSSPLGTAAIPVLFMRLPQGQLLGQRGEILGTSPFWKVLIDRIRKGQCIPILGPGVAADLLPSPIDVARALAMEWKYPFPATQSLPRVAQFVASIDDATLRGAVLDLLVEGFRRRLGLGATPPDEAGSAASAESARPLGPLSAVIAASGWPLQRGQQAENDVFRQLAELGLPLYITTNFDNLMQAALEAKLKRPVRQVPIAWSQSPTPDPQRPQFELRPPATWDDPVVLHLFGTDADPTSMVLTEDDYLDYLARVARDREFVLPTNVSLALTQHTLLFLGYRLEDLDLKVLLRGVLPNRSVDPNQRSVSVLRVAVQVESEAVDQDKQAEVTSYFQRYFQHSEIQVYWGSTQHFVAELYDRWRETAPARPGGAS